VQDARRRIQYGPGGHHIIDQYYGLANNGDNGMRLAEAAGLLASDIKLASQ